MTAHTPQLDSEGLLEHFYLSVNDEGKLTAYLTDLPLDVCISKTLAAYKDLLQADRAAFADRVLAVVPEKPSNELIQLSLQNGKPQQAASYNGYAAAINDVTTAITNLVAEERGEKIALESEKGEFATSSEDIDIEVEA